MFKNFPLLSAKLLDSSIRQHFHYFVSQYYGNESGIAYTLLSLLKKDCKALHYYERLSRLPQTNYFDTTDDKAFKGSYNLANYPAARSCMVRTIKNNSNWMTIPATKLQRTFIRSIPSIINLCGRINFE